VYSVYSGRLAIESMGDDPVANYWKLRREAVLYDVPEHPIEISGPDAERLLNKVFVRDISKLKTGRANYAIACYPDGGIMMDGVLMRLADDRFWYVLANGEFFSWVMALGLEMDVTVSDPDSWVLQVQGPRSLEVLDVACDGAAPDPFKFFAVTECSMGGQPLWLSRTGWTGELGWEVYTTESGVDGPALWDHILEAGKSFDMVGTAMDSMESRRIEAGILSNGNDMTRLQNPFQAGLGKFVDMEKADFIGKQALGTADRRLLLYGIKSPQAAPFGQALVDGQRVGQVMVGAWSPFLEHGIGFVLFDEPREWLGKHVEVQDHEGAPQAGEIVSLPFYDAEKQIPRGLDRNVPDIPD
jgi:aminomethyltransferase